MAQLTMQNGGMAPFVKTAIFEMGERGPLEVVDYEFEFLGSPDQIEYVEKGCGCSTAYFEDGKIKGVLDMGKANGNQGWPPGESSVNKYVFIWLNDGEPRYIGNERKEKISNPKKSFFRLQLAGKVINE